jgi:hypothetical protein
MLGQLESKGYNVDLWPFLQAEGQVKKFLLAEKCWERKRAIKAVSPAEDVSFYWEAMLRLI